MFSRFPSIVIGLVALCSPVLCPSTELAIFNFANEAKLRASAWDAAVVEPEIQSGGGLRLSSLNLSMGYRDPVLQVIGCAEKRPRAQGVAPADNFYFSLIVTPAGGTVYSLSELTFRVAKGGDAGPRGYDIRTSVDGFKSSLHSEDVTARRPTLAEQSVSLASLGQLAGPLEIRFYIYAPTAAAALEFDDLVVRGKP